MITTSPARARRLPPAARAPIAMLLFAAGLLGLCGGCSHTTSGLELKGDTLAFLQKGVTTRGEVIETLGIPRYDLKSLRAIAYGWEIGPAWDMSYRVLGSEHDIGGGVDRWLFCIEFKEDDTVNRYEKIREPVAGPVTLAVTNWVQQTAN